MSRLDQLISQYCPSGVPRVRLGEVCESIKTGSSNRQDEDANGLYPLYVRSAEVLRSNTYEFDDKEAILIPGEGGIGDIFHYATGKYALHQRVYRLSFTSSRCCVKFVFYYLKSKFKEYILGKALNAAVSSIRKPMLESFQIPLPPLPVQEEIVRILDAMYDLVTNLDAEISARQKQYEHAREKLLTFGEEVERKTLGEIANNHDKDRRPITENQRKKGIYPYYGASGIVDYVEGYIYDGDYLLVSEDGANLVMRSTPIAFSIHGKTWVNNHAHVLSFDSSYTHKFVEFYLNSIDLAPWITGKSQPKLNQAMLNTISIPLPPLSVQQSIVERLDKMESLIQNLQAERDLRQKQYEYYREKLLLFAK